MRKKILCVVLITSLLLGSFLVQAGNIKTNTNIENNNYSDENDAELPVWNTGDYWIYDLSLSLSQTEYFDLDFSININNFKLEVEEVDDINDQYVLSMTVPQGDITGSGSMNLGGFVFSGSINNAYLDGDMFVKKSTLGIIYAEGKLEGDTNKILIPHFNVDFTIEFEEIIDNLLEKTDFSVLEFPMNTGGSWLIPFTYINMSFNAIQPNLGGGRLKSFVNEHFVQCSNWDVLNINNQEYDALKISGMDYGEINDIWYSPSIGNIIKLDYKNIDMGIGYFLNRFDMELTSTNYQVFSNPPEKPLTPIGLTDFLAGEIGEYETSTTDPDGNKIRYIFDWDDETDYTYSDFIESGETVTIEHVWGRSGEHKIRVKARDVYGYESTWSDTLSVNVTNNAPETPMTPDGPSDGEIKKSYPFTTQSSDPDGHRIKYAWDWDGDDNVDQITELYDSGVEITTPHTFYSRGNFGIKVKAIDEYGEESDWSNPYYVDMPKYKAFNSYLQSFIQFIKDIINTLFD